MTLQPPAATADLSWANPQLRQKLLSDPVAVLRDRGINAPADLPLPIVHEFVRVASLLWMDGKILPLDQFYIDPSDEGLLFGRGVWESTRTINGVPWLWSSHVERLRYTADLICIKVAPERLPDSDQVKQYVRTLTGQDVVVRLNVTAGRPGKSGIVWMSAAPLPQSPPSIRLRTCRNPVGKGQPYLTLKTFEYATRLRLAQEAADAGYDTALLLDADGNVLEAAHANVFVRLPDGWATPPVDAGLMPGTVRRHLLEQSPLTVRERVVAGAQLEGVQEAFVTNSNVGIVPVAAINGRTLPVGGDTLKLMKWLQPPAANGIQYRFVERKTTPR